MAGSGQRTAWSAAVLGYAWPGGLSGPSRVGGLCDEGSWQLHPGKVVRAHGAEHETFDPLAQRGELLRVGQGDPWRLLVEDRQGLAVQRRTFLLLRLAAGLGDQRIEGLVAPAGLVLAAFGGCALAAIAKRP